MQAAARSYLASGVALVGAGAIAISPVAPPLPDIHVPAISSAAVELNALTNPLEAWAEVLGTAVNNIGAIGNTVLADPAPILSQAIANQLANAGIVSTAAQNAVNAVLDTLGALPTTLNAVTEQLRDGNLTGAMETITVALLPVVLTLTQPLSAIGDVFNNTVQNFASAVEELTSPSWVVPVTIGITGPVLSTLNALTATAQAVVDAAGENDFEGVANALINAPANITNGFLNGHGTVLGFVTLPGLLTPSAGSVLKPAGPLGLLQDLRESVAEAIGATSGAARVGATGAALGSSANTVTLDVAKDGAPKATATDKTDEATQDAVGSSTEASTGTEGTADESPDSAIDKVSSMDPADHSEAAPVVKTNVVKDSLVAVPGKTGTTPRSERTNPLKQVRNDIRSTVKNVTDGFKKAAEGLTGKSKTKSQTTAGSSKSGDDHNSGDSSSASSSDAA